MLSIAKRFRPELETLNAVDRAAAVTDICGLLYGAPLVVAGLAWLIIATDLSLLAREWPALIMLLFLILLFERLRFFVYMDVQELSVSAEGSLSSVATWSGALLFGPSALWLPACSRLIGFTRDWRNTPATADRWGLLRSFALRFSATILAGLFALALYEHWGGAFPLSGLSLDVIMPALYITLVWSILALLVYVPYVFHFGTYTFGLTGSTASMWSLVRVTAVGLVLPVLAAPFGILAAGLHTQNGLEIFLLFFGGLLMGSWMARQLSQAVGRSQQRSRELERLEQLGQAIISAPPDASTLPGLLQEHVPAMFPSSQVEIRVVLGPSLPNHILLRHPDAGDHPALQELVWDWVRGTAQARCFQTGELWPGEPAPNGGRGPARGPLVIAPVIDTASGGAIGGVCVVPRRDITGAASLLPAVQTLAAQISSTLHGARVYNQTLAHQKVEQELAVAGEIQARILPKTLPHIPGWQLAVTLDPARQTSGDFYDVIPLPNGRLGLLVADVADKGTGAALYMALSRTLIRTYAVEHHTRPDFALRVANNRILLDTELDMFVTVFYAVLDPLSGVLTYCNAGHNPPLLLRAQNGDTPQRLTRTGIPLGIFSGETWKSRTVELGMGDVLILYTDGVTEAQDPQRDFFGEERLLAVARDHRMGSAQEIQAAVMEEIYAFMGDQPQFDDIALLVLVREA